MTTLKEAIKEARPNLAESSVKTYLSILTNLHKRIFRRQGYGFEGFYQVPRDSDTLERYFSECKKNYSLCSFYFNSFIYLFKWLVQPLPEKSIVMRTDMRA